MKIVIIGAGAMGSIYAALLADAGNEVIAVTRNVEHRDAIRASGLRVEGASGDRTVSLSVSDEVPSTVADLVIIAVKARDAASVAAGLSPLLGEHTLILTMQNGLGSAELVARQIGSHRLMAGIAGGFGASMVQPGHIHHSGMQKILIGPFDDLSIHHCERIAGVWQQAGFRAAAVTDILSMQWEKLICNVAFSALSALTGLTVGGIVNDTGLYEIGLQAAREAFDVASALDIPLSVTDPVAHVEAFASQVMDAKPSMRADHEARRRSEIEFINGAVPREAARVHLTAPVNQTLTALVMQRESLFP